jgi:hypothetical protein
VNIAVDEKESIVPSEQQLREFQKRRMRKEQQFRGASDFDRWLVEIFNGRGRKNL